jgi:putative ABC transport system substrate-binding protein
VHALRHIGYLGTDDQDTGYTRAAFVQALRALGWIEGENMTFSWRYTGGEQDRFVSLAEDLVREKVDVIVTTDSVSTRAAKQATSRIPIVMDTTSRPVENGFVASFARPGGNVTGITGDLPGLHEKRVELLNEVVTSATRVAAIWNPDPSRVSFWDETLSAANRLHMQIQSMEVNTSRDFEIVFEAIARDRPDALIALTNPIVFNFRKAFIDFAARQQLPAMWFWPQFTLEGGLMAYSPNLRDINRRAAMYVDKILRGASPADLPVERPATVDFVVNTTIAQTLGIAFSADVKAQVTEWVQ